MRRPELNRAVNLVARDFPYPSTNPVFEYDGVNLVQLMNYWSLEDFRRHFSFNFGTQVMVKIAQLTSDSFGVPLKAETDLQVGMLFL